MNGLRLQPASKCNKCENGQARRTAPRTLTCRHEYHDVLALLDSWQRYVSALKFACKHRVATGICATSFPKLCCTDSVSAQIAGVFTEVRSQCKIWLFLLRLKIVASCSSWPCMNQSVDRQACDSWAS